MFRTPHLMIYIGEQALLNWTNWKKKLGSSALKMGIILAILSLSGKMPFSRDRLIISAKGAEIR